MEPRIRTWAPVVVLLLVALQLGWVTAAGARPARGMLEGAKAKRLAARALERCPDFEFAEMLPSPDVSDDPLGDPDLDVGDLSARRRGRLLELGLTSSGSGVDAVHSVQSFLVDLRACTAATMMVEWPDGTFCNEIKFGSEKRGAPTAAERRQLAALQGWIPARRGHPAFGASALLCAGTQKSTARPAQGWSTKLSEAGQAWLRGRPRPTRSLTVWPGEGAGNGEVASAVHRLKVARRQGRSALYIGQLGGRAGAQVVAQYDGRRKRHRWLYHAGSGPVRWLCQGQGLVLGVVSPPHPVYLASFGWTPLVFDLRRGTVHQLLVPGMPREGELEGIEVDDPKAPISCMAQKAVFHVGKKPVTIPLSELAAHLRGAEKTKAAAPQPGGK